MNILFRVDYRPPMHRFKCDKCRTIWECEEHEVEIVFDRNEMYLSCVCPVCGKRVMKYECRAVRNTKAVDK